MTSKRLFSLGVVIGAVALVMLFVFPADLIWLLPLFALSGVLTGSRTSSRPESTKDAAIVALTLAFFGVALVFAFFLIPDSFWVSVHFPIPDWLYGRAAQGREVVPVWARIVLTVIWLVVTYRRFQQLGTRGELGA